MSGYKRQEETFIPRECDGSGVRLFSFNPLGVLVRSPVILFSFSLVHLDVARGYTALSHQVSLVQLD